MSAQPATTGELAKLLAVLKPETPLLMPGPEAGAPYIPAAVVYDGRALIVMPAEIATELIQEWSKIDG